MPGLYIVATPIGNLGDITMRAADILARCDGVACEDTRVTGKLMKHLKLSKPLWRYDDHSGERDRARLVESMREKAVALVSDAGTPLVSDPGYRLVRDCREQGKTVIFSSHIMSEIDLLADDLAIIHKGNLIFEGTMQDFRDQMQAETLTKEFIRIINEAEVA